MKNLLLMTKIGMSQLSLDGKVVPVTLLKYLDNKVLSLKTTEKEGYSAAVVGFSSLSKNEERKLSRPVMMSLKKIGQGFFRKLLEVRGDNLPEVGSSLGVSLFSAGSMVDVTGSSKGKGFAGAMKRHGFGGMRATHGVSVTHRVHGSTGNRTLPGRVFKNKKMAGHMGAERVTIQNLRVCDVNEETGIIAVRGAVPGCINSYVLVREAVKL